MDNATPSGGAQVIATTNTNPLVQFRAEIEARSNELKMALPSHISPEKFQRTILTAIQQNPNLLTASRRSLLLACMKAAQDGLLPDGREAALVEFKKSIKTDDGWQSIREVAYIPMIHGIRKKILQARDANGKAVVLSLYTSVVYKKEVEAKQFYYDLTRDPPLGHRPLLDLTAEETTDDQIVGAYSIAHMADGYRSFKFLRRFEIDKIRETSQTGATKDRNGKARQPKGPWVDWFPQMCEKTVAKAHADSLPQSGDLILDAYDQDFDAARSAAEALGRAEEDEPQLIGHDPETGEIIEATAEHADEGANAAGKEEKKPKGKAKPEKDEKPPAEEEKRDELGVTKDPGEAKAEEILADMAAAQTIIDLDKIYAREETHIVALPDEIKGGVDAAYNRHSRRLATQRAEAEPVK